MPRQSAIRKVKWTAEEDALLLHWIEIHGATRWTAIAGEMPGRSGKQCRERWTNRLDPSLNRDAWTAREDAVLVHQQKVCGNCWAKIASSLPHRSPNAIKNRWSWLSRHKSRGLSREDEAPAKPSAPRLETIEISIAEWSEALERSQTPEWMHSDGEDATAWTWGFNERVRSDRNFGSGWLSWE
jgi:hypothetical protein